jgi:hypothetical protein
MLNKLIITQGQVAELRALVVNGNAGGATGVSDYQQTSQNVPVSCGLQVAAAASVNPSSVAPSLNNLRTSDALVSQVEKLVNSLDVTQGQSNNKARVDSTWGRQHSLGPHPVAPGLCTGSQGHEGSLIRGSQCLTAGSRLSFYRSNAGMDTLSAMITHMKALFAEASFSGWGPGKFAHGWVSTDLEDGMYGWLDSYRLSESRHHGIQLRQSELNQEQVSARCEPSLPA